jgi:YspA, cpYpsA-related SLOG family
MLAQNGVILLVTGSRSIKDASAVAAVLDALPFTVAKLVHGGAIGVDTLAGRWAASKGIPVKIVRPDFRAWPVARYRYKAYGVRDREMVDMADEVVAIWDGYSSGTKLTFEYAETQQKLHAVKIL